MNAFTGAQDGILLSREVSGRDPPLEGLGGGGGVGIVRVSEASPPPDVVSGLGLASTEATPDCSQLTQAGLATSAFFLFKLSLICMEGISVTLSSKRTLTHSFLLPYEGFLS